MSALSPSSEKLSLSDLTSRIHGCWLGKSIGGTLGLPAEGKMERLNFSFYDPVPTIAPPNDDLELQLVWLDVVEKAGNSLSQDDFAQAWLNHIHYMWDEYGRCRWNLRRGVPVENVGTFENHFHAGMGSPIRSEIWACLFPGDPDSAAHYAALDASLDHGTEGIAGEVFFAVMQSLALTGLPLEEAITRATSYIPAESEVSRAIEFVREQRRLGVAEWTCWKELLVHYGNENFTHAPLNVALTIWALIYGDEDFEKSILLAVNGGYDTDCTAATVGATLGFFVGEKGIPERWITPIGEGVFVGAGIQGINAAQTLRELTDRTVALVGKLEAKEWDATLLSPPESKLELASLPGTINITPLGSESTISWANGELPIEVKQAGGAKWSWEVSVDEPRHILFLAREGARLFIDDQLAIECPAGLPYVPAPHRCPEGSRVSVDPGVGTHEVRIELNSKDARQEASLILAYPNFHIAPWTSTELPLIANLPLA